MPFTIVKGRAHVKQVRPKRGIKDDSVVSVIVVLDAEDVDCNAAAAALGADNPHAVANGFFRLGGDEPARYLNLRSIRAGGAWENHHRLSIGGHEPVRVRKVNAISLSPQSFAKFDATFSVQIDEPPNGMLDLLTHALHSVVAFTLEHDPELFDQQVAQEAAERAAEPDQASMTIPEGSPLAGEVTLMKTDEYVAAHASDLPPVHGQAKPGKSIKAPKPGDTDKALKALADKAKAGKAVRAGNPLPKIVPRPIAGKAPKSTQGKTSAKPAAKPARKP